MTHVLVETVLGLALVSLAVGGFLFGLAYYTFPRRNARRNAR